MKRCVAEKTFFDDLMKTVWYPETVDRYFAGDYQTVYEHIMKDFEQRRIVIRNGGDWVTTVKP
jgi:hypothetical protein